MSILQSNHILPRQEQEVTEALRQVTGLLSDLAEVGQGTPGPTQPAKQVNAEAVSE